MRRLKEAMLMLQPVEISKASKLISHGPTTIITAQTSEARSAKAVGWITPMNARPPQVVAVLGSSFTTELIRQSREFVINVPTAKMMELTFLLGTTTGRSLDKFSLPGMRLREAQNVSAPLIEGSVACLECRLTDNHSVEDEHDLYIADVVAAWADGDVFRDGEYSFSSQEQCTFHHTSGGRFRVTGTDIHTFERPETRP
ncbi:flavin reductase family protein [Agrobacterium sp. 22-226-1]